jgi:hypothetical protein
MDWPSLLGSSDKTPRGGKGFTWRGKDHVKAKGNGQRAEGKRQKSGMN